MNSKIWGKHAWIFLHSITFAYPDNPSEEDKRNYKNYFESLQNVLPCDVCKINYKNNIKKIPITEYLDSKTELISWLVKIHNEVNKELGKKHYSGKEVLKYYEKLSNEKSSNEKTDNGTYNFSIIKISILILLVILLIKERKRIMQLFIKNEKKIDK